MTSIFKIILLQFSLGFVSTAPTSLHASAGNTKETHLEFKSPLSTIEQVICVMGDTGNGKNDQYTVADALQKYGCTQIRIVGDVIYPKGIESPNDQGFQDRFVLPYKKLLAQSSKIKIFPVLGNHDHKGSRSAFYEAVSKYPSIVFPHYYYTEKWSDGVCIFNLDTDYYENPKHWLKLRNIEHSVWLRGARNRLKKQCKFTLTIGHHPLRSVGKHGNASFFTKAFLKNNVIGKSDLYIAGHDHNLSDEGIEKGTRLLVSGAGAQLRRLYHKVKPGNFAISELGFVALKFQSAGDKILAEYRFEILVRDANGLATTDTKTVHSGTVFGLNR